MVDYWIAEFKDGSILEQFDGDKENPFSMVEDKKDSLVSFKVVSEDTTYEANISENYIKENNTIYKVKGKNPKLIYFRRRKVRFDPRTKEILESRTTHHLGLKTSTDEKKFEISPSIGKKSRSLSLNEKGSKKTLKAETIIGEKEDGKVSLDSDLR